MFTQSSLTQRSEIKESENIPVQKAYEAFHRKLNEDVECEIKSLFTHYYCLFPLRATSDKKAERE